MLADDGGATRWGSLLPAVWSYMLAARARGLGTVDPTCTFATSRRSPRSSACSTTSAGDR